MPLESAVHLRRIDPEQRVARFYSLHLAPTLFGAWDLVREWGRIGSPGTVRLDAFESEEAAADALQRIASQKRRRGYG